MGTHFQIESARFAVSAGDALLRTSLNVQSLLHKSSALFSSCVTKVLDESSSKNPFAGTEKAKN